MAFLAFLGLNILAAASGGIFSPGQWYEELRKPVWQPPKWAFPLVWMILYFLNAWAGWMIWVSSGFDEARTWALVVYGISLVLNAGWSWIFFGLRKMKLALVEAILLWLSVAVELFERPDVFSGSGQHYGINFKSTQIGENRRIQVNESKLTT